MDDQGLFAPNFARIRGSHIVVQNSSNIARRQIHLCREIWDRMDGRGRKIRGINYHFRTIVRGFFGPNWAKNLAQESCGVSMRNPVALDA
jgi:hypothetical protein